MTLSKNAFRSRLILARKLAHEQIVDQDKRLVWTLLQLRSLIFPVLVVLILSFIFSVWFSFLIYFRLTLSDSLFLLISFSLATICNSLLYSFLSDIPRSFLSSFIAGHLLFFIYFFADITSWSHFFTAGDFLLSYLEKQNYMVGMKLWMVFPC